MSGIMEEPVRAESRPSSPESTYSLTSLKPGKRGLRKEVPLTEAYAKTLLGKFPEWPSKKVIPTLPAQGGIMIQQKHSKNSGYINCPKGAEFEVVTLYCERAKAPRWTGTEYGFNNLKRLYFSDRMLFQKG